MLPGIFPLKNTIQAYAWGSKTAIAELLGQTSPAAEPQAELWMGAHPKAPSLVVTREGDIPLNLFIEKDPEGVLGQATTHKFKGQLPYLFKVLAAAKPLSIQAHPNLEQARQGFAQENRQGIDIRSPERNYRDANHKPECICALTDYWALNGFQAPDTVARKLETLCPETLGAIIQQTIWSEKPTDLRLFYEAIMAMGPVVWRQVVSESLNNLDQLGQDDAAGIWMQRLQDDYPYDIGVLSPAILNLVCLKPGEALFLPSGQLHAYLEGVGIELMANSDNVLRGGLTPKHVDTAQLLEVLDFNTTDLNLLKPFPISSTESAYPTFADEFQLSVIEVEPQRSHISGPVDAAQILLCTSGRATVSGEAQSQDITVCRGSSILVIPVAGTFQIKGQATLYKATLPSK